MKRAMCVAAIAVIATGCSVQAADYAVPTVSLAGPSGYARLADSGAMAGSNGGAGASGGSETQGADGQPGTLPPVVVADHWVPYRSFRFDDGRADIRAVDQRQIADVAAYLAQNPALRLGIDDSIVPGVTDVSELRLGRRRVAVIRDALLQAGTPAYRIEMGAFADPRRRRNQQVELLLLGAQ